MAVFEESRVTVTDAGLKKLSPMVTAAVAALPPPPIVAPQRGCPAIVGPVEKQHVFANSAPATTSEVNCTDSPRSSRVALLFYTGTQGKEWCRQVVRLAGEGPA